jgi:hypothetical protein
MPKEIYYINFKVQLITFRVVCITVYTRVPVVLPTSEATLEIISR